MRTVPRVRDVWRVCVPRCVIATRIVFKERSVLRPPVNLGVTRRRIVDQEKFVKMETVFVVLVLLILLLDVQILTSVRSQDVIQVPSVKTLQDHSNVHVPED